MFMDTRHCITADHQTLFTIIFVFPLKVLAHLMATLTYCNTHEHESQLKIRHHNTEQPLIYWPNVNSLNHRVWLSRAETPLDSGALHLPNKFTSPIRSWWWNADFFPSQAPLVNDQFCRSPLLVNNETAEHFHSVITSVHTSLHCSTAYLRMTDSQETVKHVI